MPEFSFLQDILILLGLALANAFLFSRLKQSPIIGYLVTGMLVGPYGFHLIKGEHEVELMAEIGVILLLFTIGIEFPFSRILRLRKPMLISGTAQVALTALLVFLGIGWLGLNNDSALALAMALALSSTAIVLKMLLERGETDTVHGRTALAILLFQDLCVVFFLVTLPLLGVRKTEVSLLALIQAAGLMGGLALFTRYLLNPLMKGILRTRSQELFRLTLLGLILGTAWVTSQAGLSLALGAFLAGLALAESDYSHQALADILPFRDTFLALFFVSMGMLVNMRLLAQNLPLVFGLAVLLALVKAGTGTIAALLSGNPLRISLLAGLMLFQGGEFAFVLLAKSLDIGILSADAYQMALSVIALSMVATPLVIPRAPALAAGIVSLLGRRGKEWTPEVQERTGNLEGHVIIAGYGLSGKNVGRILREMQIPYVFIELNGESVRLGQKRGEFIVYGDATSPPVLEALGGKKARALVLAINDPSALVRAIRAGRELNPDLYILARTRYVAELDYLGSLGADEIIPDELEASLQLAAFLLRRFEIAEGKILQYLSTLRREHYDRLRPGGGSSTIVAGPLSVLEGGQIEFQAVPEDSPCLGKSLAELAFRNRTGVMVAGVIRRERTIYSPPANLHLEKGDTLILLGGPEDVTKAREFIHGHPV